MVFKIPLLPDQEFFTMGEVCRLVQVPAHTLRYWEARVGFLRPARRVSGHRRYTRQDVSTIISIKELVHGRKMTLAGVRKELLARKKDLRPAEGGTVEGAAAAPASTLRLLREVKKEIQTLVSELSSG